MRHALVPLTAAASLVLASCEFGKTAIGPGREQIVVHGVLNPGQYEQTILVERTLTGRVEIDDDRPFDPENPVVTGGGVPETGATVIVYGPGGDSAVAAEPAPGLYRFFNVDPDNAPPGSTDALPLVPGQRYRLRVRASGRAVTGATTIPMATPTPAGASNERFNRDRDSIFLFWGAIPAASRYALRVETPRGGYQQFVDSLEYLISGKLRNIFVEGLPSVFVPGFTQAVTLGAVDTNYFDYYRSGNDPFTGTGLINHLEGGLGLFGSYVLLRSRSLLVLADVDQPIEGRYVRTQGGPSWSPTFMQLYVDAQAGGTVQVTGNYSPPASESVSGLIGVFRSPSITIAFLRAQHVADTLTLFTGRVDGGGLAGRFRGSDERVTFLKQLAP